MSHLVFRGSTIPLGGTREGISKGYRYVCPTCGELWGCVELAEDHGVYIVFNRPCENHGTRFSRGGSILRELRQWEPNFGPTTEKFCQSSSDEFLRHEVLMIINQRVEK